MEKDLSAKVKKKKKSRRKRSSKLTRLKLFKQHKK